MKKLFLLPDFHDEEKQRTGQHLNLIILNAIVMLSVFYIFRMIQTYDPASPTNIFLVAMVAFMILLRIVMHFGFIRPASFFLIAVTWVAMTYQAYSNDGIRDITITAYVVVILMASLLLGWRYSLPFFGLSIAAMWVIAVAQENGTRVFSTDTPINIVSGLTIIFSLILVAIYLIVSSLQRSLQNAKTSAQELSVSNKELQALRVNLEKRVAERTKSLELATEVGRSVSQVRALDVMLKDAVEIIRSRFDLYYTQVYLTNPGQTELVLQAGTGKVGAELLGRNHRLPFNTGSINGRAAVEKHSTVISDTTTSATFRPNPLLPDTRSEMAVPLMVGEKVVGVLDLQSRTTGALSEELLPAFEALAGQLAIAIQNASLLAEAEQARAELESQARRLVRTNWQEYLDAIHKPEQTGFVFEQNQVKPVDTAGETPIENAVNEPIAVAGEPIGSIVVEMETEKQTARNMELVKTIALQVAQQVENLRLLESTERYRIEAEQAMQRVTREGWKNYLETGIGKLGYLYDRKEVVPVEADHRNGKDAVTLPIKVRDEEVGKLALMEIDRNDKQSIELANEVAERLSAHIESLRQFTQTQSALAQSEKLFAASRELTRTTDLQGLVKATVNSVGISEIDRAILGVLHYDSNNEPDGMTITANWASSTDLPATPVGTYYPKEALKTLSLFMGPEPLFFNDMLNDERVDERMKDVPHRLNYRAVAALPLFSGSRQNAVLLLEGKEPHNFTPDEMRLFAALAPQIATVMENRRQYEQAQKQAERESALNVISQKIQSATTVEAVLQIAARELGHALGAPLTIAQLGIKDK
jgi:GAF domain-containing protein